MNIHSYEADATYERIFYEQRLDYMSISSRSGRAIAHDEEPAPSSHIRTVRRRTLRGAHIERTYGLSPSKSGAPPRGVDGGVTATGVLSRQRGNLITIVSTR